MSTATRHKRFLFVDDDSDFLAGLRELFVQMSRGSWEIATAENHSQALAQLGRQSVDVVILDYNMPVMDGLQFLRLLRRTHPGQQVVMLTSRTDEALRKQCIDNGAALFIEKLTTPAGFQGIYSALDALAEAVPQAGFRGMMRQVGLQDVLQMECLGRKSSILEVFTGQARGRIFIEDGSIIHAECGSLEGEVALYSVLAWRGGEFNLQPYTKPARVTISGQYEFLLMEAARLSDEGAQSAGAESPSIEPPIAVEATAAEPAAISPPTLEPLPFSQSTFQPGPISQSTFEPTPSEFPRVEEVILCSGAGELVYEQGCSSIPAALDLLALLESQTTQLSSIVPAGRFDRLEVLTSTGRVVCQLQPNMRLLVRTTAANFS